MQGSKLSTCVNRPREPWFNSATLIVGLAVLSHITYGINIFIDVTSANASDIKPTADIIGPYFAAIIYLFAAIGAMIGAIGKPKIWKAFAGVLQQALLYASATGAISCVIQGKFADGTVKTVSFLANDKCLIIGLAILHTVALIWIAIKGFERYFRNILIK